MHKIKVALRSEIDAIKNGDPLESTEATPKKAGGRKRKAADDEDSNGATPTPKKQRARPKKQVTPDVQDDDEEVKAELVKAKLEDDGEAEKSL